MDLRVTHFLNAVNFFKGVLSPPQRHACLYAFWNDQSPETSLFRAAPGAATMAVDHEDPFALDFLKFYLLNDDMIEFRKFLRALCTLLDFKYSS